MVPLLRLLWVTPGIVLWGSLAWDYRELWALREDQTRAVGLGPLHQVSLQEVQSKGKASLSFTVPGDEQWKRIGSRWGYPDLLIGCFQPSARFEGEFRWLPLEPLHVRLYRDDQEVTLQPVEGAAHLQLAPHAPGLTRFKGSGFPCAPGVDLVLEARVSSGEVLPTGLLVVIPYYKSNLTWKAILVAPAIEEGALGIKRGAACVFLFLGLGMVLRDFRRRKTV